MRRIIQKVRQPEATPDTSPAHTIPPLRGGLQGVKLEQRLRLRRTPAYVDALSRLDAGTHGLDVGAMNELIKAIAAEFPELTVDQRPLGLVAQCRLGHPYEVHVCDLTGGILEHYKRGRSMPSPFERARSLALHPSYLFIEVYPDSLRAIARDGSVSVITG
jgi:hypothetical protein